MKSYVNLAVLLFALFVGAFFGINYFTDGRWMSLDSRHAASIFSLDDELKGWRYRVEDLPYDAKQLPLDIWEEQQQETLWKPYDFPERPPVSSDAKYVWLQTRLPDHVEPGDALFFGTTDQSFRIWVGDKLIAEYGTLERGEYTWGNRWHVVRLPNYVSGQTVTMEVHSDVEESLGVFDRFFIRNRGVSYLLLLIYDIPFFIGMAAAMSLLFLVSAYLSKTMRYNDIYRGFFVLQTVYLLWMVAASNFHTFLLDAPGFWWAAENLLLYALFAVAHYMVAQLVDIRYKRIAMTFYWLHVAYTVAVALAYFFIQKGALDAAPNIFLLLVAVGGVTSVITLFLSMHARNPYSRAMVLPVGALFLTCLIDGILAQYRLLPWTIYTMALASLTFFNFVVGVLGEQIRQELSAAMRVQNLKCEVDGFKQQAQLDPLTGTFNRYKFDDVYRDYSSIAKRTDGKLSLCMLDIDFFKSVNDTYGHDIGDVVLRGFAKLIRNTLEERRHVLIRWGGEEFIILCLHQSAEEAATFVEVIRKKVEASDICPYRQVTCSIGVAEWRETDVHPEALVKRADTALYEAKEDGRNRVKIHAEVDPEMHKIIHKNFIGMH